jgi:uncharacterized membrane protein
MKAIRDFLLGIGTVIGFLAIAACFIGLVMLALMILPIVLPFVGIGLIVSIAVIFVAVIVLAIYTIGREAGKLFSGGKKNGK